MLEQVLTELRNWFRVRDAHGGVYPGTYTVENGKIALPFLREGQYYRVLGSVFNDGLHRYGDETDALRDETFDGSVWALAVPRAVIDLAEEITAWQTKYGNAAQSPYQSESFGGYSYTKAAGASGAGGTWQSVFAARLNAYRKI